MEETKHTVFFIYPWDIDALLISRWKGANVCEVYAV